MALKVYDGYDHYNSNIDMQNRTGFLQYVQGTSNIIYNGFVPGPFGDGLALSLTQGINGILLLNSVFQDRNSQFLVGKREIWSSGCGMIFYFNDTVANQTQCSVQFDPSNFSISLWRGNPSTGTMLAITSNNIWDNNTWNFVEMKVGIDNATGYITVRVNDAVIISVTNVDTQTTANPWADSLRESMILNATNGVCIMDDFYYCDSTAGPGPNPMNDFLGDARCVTGFAIGNDSVQFTPFLTSENMGGTSTSATNANPANTMSFAPFTVTHTGSLGTSINVIFQAAVTGNVVVGIYDSDGPGGAPGTLLAQTSPVTNPGTGSQVFTFGAPVDLNTNRTYYWAIQSDATASTRMASGSGSTWYKTNQAYTGTMPASVASNLFTTVGQGVASINGVMTLTNAGNVSEIKMDSDTTYNYSNTVSDVDLLNFQPLPAVINLILAVQVTGAYRKDDAGTRAVQQGVQSGATTAWGLVDHYLGVGTYNYFTDLFVLNPDTSAPWTVAEVNGLSAGYKVSV